jgi:hypothetical protein
MSLPDYYRILHVQPDAPAPIIHASYRTLVERAFGGTLGSAGLERATGTAPAHDEPAGSPGTRSCLFCGALHDLKRMLERDDECGRCLSPLYPAERHRLEYSGQRMLQRVPKQHTIHVWVTWPQDAPIRADMRDLSLNGMSFTAAVRFEANQIVRIDCTELRALGRIAHIERDAAGAGRFSAGVEFLTLRFRQVRGSFVSAEA